MRARFRLPIRLAAATLAIGCGSAAALPPGARASASGAPAFEELAGATYAGLQDQGAPVTLRDGLWQGPPFVEGGAARPELRLVRDFRVEGDLDGDGAPEAVALLAQSSGGTGSRVYAVVAARRDAAVVNRGTALLGDRVQVRAARIDAGRLLFFVVRAGPEDAMCCPGELTVQGFELRPGAGLEPVAACESPGRLSPVVMGGAEWVLKAWDFGDPAPAEPTVTLAYRDGKLSGSAGCNRYFAAASPGDGPGAIAIGSVGATRMACPEPVEAVEERFLDQLGRVERFGFLAGRLALTYRGDAGIRSMLFEAGPAGATGEDPGDALQALFCR